ncbi:MAG: hypothetical protein KZQ82_06460 [Candidatus Thiodiazotropha sp. (ex Lucinoma annulata)]|nr:hypothetical protein [Candidatus Thiodiazotropha sp. (ex Lucinoma annulata)]
MDFLTFLANIIDNLAWPGLIFATLWLFKVPLGLLIDAIRNAKFKYIRGETSIEGELNTIREMNPSIEEREPPDNVKTLAESSPLKAISESWRKLEASASTATAMPSFEPPIKIADTLIDKNILSISETEAFYKLFEIQKEVTKPDSRLITDVSSASTYSSIAYGLSDKIEGSGNLKAGPAHMEGKGTVTPQSAQKEREEEP